jgi:hypothetical protein
MKNRRSVELIQELLSPAMETCRFSKVGSEQLAWSRPSGEDQTTVWVQLDKNGWDDLWGSMYAVEFQKDKSDQPGAGDLMSRQRIGYLLEGHPEIEELRVINNQVIATLPGFIKEQQEFVEMDGERVLLLGYEQVHHPYQLAEDIWLHFYDEKDLIQWGQFLSARLERLASIFEQPILSPTQEARHRYDRAIARVQAASSYEAKRLELAEYIETETNTTFRKVAEKLLSES